MPDELTQRGPAGHPLGRRTALVLDVGRSSVDDAAVRNPRRTDALACAAADTEVDVLHLLLVERQRPALPLRHQVDAAARRLGLESCDAERRAGVETQAAMHAGGEIVIREPCKGVRLPRLRGSTAARRGWGWLKPAQTTYLPGFKAPSGSNAFFMRRMMSSVAGDVPHAPTSRMKSSGAASMTSVPPAPSTLDLTSRTDCASPPIAQCATPTPGDAHHRSGWGRTSPIFRHADRGTAIRAHSSGPLRECLSQTAGSASSHSSPDTTRSTASGLPRYRASTRPSEDSSTADGASGVDNASSAASQAPSFETVTSCSGFGKTLNDAATITPSEPSAP